MIKKYKRLGEYDRLEARWQRVIKIRNIRFDWPINPDIDIPKGFWILAIIDRTLRMA